MIWTEVTVSWKVFFADYCEDKILESKDARAAAMEEILHSMDCVLHTPGNFIGVIDGGGVTLQFMVNDDGTIQIDIPAPRQRGSYVKTGKLAECLDLLRNIGSNINVENIAGLAFQPW